MLTGCGSGGSCRPTYRSPAARRPNRPSNSARVLPLHVLARGPARSDAATLEALRAGDGQHVTLDEPGRPTSRLRGNGWVNTPLISRHHPARAHPRLVTRGQRPAEPGRRQRTRCSRRPPSMMPIQITGIPVAVIPGPGHQPVVTGTVSAERGRCLSWAGGVRGAQALPTPVRPRRVNAEITPSPWPPGSHPRPQAHLVRGPLHLPEPSPEATVTDFIGYRIPGAILGLSTRRPESSRSEITAIGTSPPACDHDGVNVVGRHHAGDRAKGSVGWTGDARLRAWRPRRERARTSERASCPRGLRVHVTGVACSAPLVVRCRANQSRGQLRHVLERARLLEQMRRAGHDLELVRAAQEAAACRR